MTIVSRRPAAPLAAFVDYLWASERPALPHAREWGLPGVGADIIVPLGELDSLRRFDGIDDDAGIRYAGGIVQGARERPFLRDTSRPSAVVGRLRLVRPDPFAASVIERLDDPRTSVRDVQVASGLSPGAFIRRFRALTGLGPKRYRELRRFASAAAHGHARPAASWAEIACDAGYADQAHFAREFRRFAGTTPGRYRHDATEHAMHVVAR